MRIHYTATVWHGGFYEFITRAFEALGHEVVFFKENGTPSQVFLERVGTRLPKMTYAATDMFRNAVGRDWLLSVRKANPDLILLQHVPNISAEFIQEARSLRKPIFYWMDSPSAGSQAKDVLACLECVDKIFTIDRSRFWMTVLHEPKSFEFLPLAGDEKIFYPLNKKMEKKYDVTFVGSLPPQSGDGYIRAKILAHIPDKYRVGVFGTGIEYWYRYFPKLASRAKSGRLSAAALNELYNESKILLNIHSTYHIASASARTFEAALAGTFQIVDHRADHDELFPSDLVKFDFADEVNPLLERWLDPGAGKEREEITKKIREHVLLRHTWKHRAETMLKFLKA